MAGSSPKNRKSTSKPENSQSATSSLPQVQDPWKGKAVTKASGLIHRVLDFFEPESILERQRARAESRELKAQSKANARLIAAEGKSALRSIEERAKARADANDVRQQRNIESVIETTFDALPKSDEGVSDAPVSDDFVHRLFADCKDIGDEQMQTLWGRIFAGEIVRPGSFHPKTLGVLKDMTKQDANLFATLCNCTFEVFVESPVIIDVENDIYQNLGLNFSTLTHLEDLGLITFDGLATFMRSNLPAEFEVRYVGKTYLVENIQLHKQISVGRVIFTEAGRQLAQLCEKTPVTGLTDYVFTYWARSGFSVAQSTTS